MPTKLIMQLLQELNPPISRKSQKKSDSAISFEESPSKKKSAKAKKVAALKPKSTKKKTLVKANRGKGLNVLSKVALSKAAQLKEATKQSKKDFHISQASGSGDGTDFESGVPDEQHLKTTDADEGTVTIPRVPNVPKYESKSEKESWGNSGKEDEDDKNDSGDNSDNYGNDDDDANDDDNQEEEEEIDDEETMDDDEDDEVTKELYDDVNVNLGNEDTDMTNADQADNEIASLMETSARHVTAVSKITSDFTTTIPLPPLVTNLEKDLSEIKQVDHLDFATHVIDKNVTKSLKAVFLARSSSQPKSTYEAATSLFEFELTKILLDKIEESKSHLRADHKRKLYDALVESYNTDKDLFNTYGELFKLKRSQDDSYKDQDPFAGSDRGTKRRKSRKEAESSKDSRSKEKKSSSTSKYTYQSQDKSSRKSAHAEEQSHIVDDSGVQQDQEYDTGNNDEQPVDKEVSKDDYKPVSLIRDHRGRQIIPQDFFINNELDYLKGGDLSRRYSTSVTKTKAATYEIKWIEDLGPKRQHFYGFVANMSSSKDVYSRKRIITVTRLTIMKKYDYNHLEEIQVHREDKKLYKFREGGFPRLRLQGIEDMLLPLVQKKLTNLTINERLMCADELHKFCDGTLNDFRFAINDIAKGIRMEYLPKRKWRGLHKQKAHVMIQDINKQLYERMLMRNLEKFVGRREYGNDLRLLEQTI
nr:hypothetical protein [Tanacetum cinerariifolium]